MRTTILLILLSSLSFSALAQSHRDIILQDTSLLRMEEETSHTWNMIVEDSSLTFQTYDSIKVMFIDMKEFSAAAPREQEAYYNYVVNMVSEKGKFFFPTLAYSYKTREAHDQYVKDFPKYYQNQILKIISEEDATDLVSIDPEGKIVVKSNETKDVEKIKAVERRLNQLSTQQPRKPSFRSENYCFYLESKNYIPKDDLSPLLIDGKLVGEAYQLEGYLTTEYK